MSKEDMEFLTFEEAKKIIGNVIEEEHVHEDNRRILTAYDLDGNELCWFDAGEVMAKVSVNTGRPKTEADVEAEKIAAVEYVMSHIPAWAAGR